MGTPSTQDRRLRACAWFLAISYGLAAPLTAIVEYREHTLSERFDLPATLIYFTCAVQVVCAIGVLRQRVAAWSAAALTLITIGAIAAHLRIGSPATSIAAVIYTAVQIWFWFHTSGGGATSRE